MERESKMLILKYLTETLQHTRQYEDLDHMGYDPQKEIVVLTYRNGHTQTVNVAMDSGIAMIKDIIRQTS